MRCVIENYIEKWPEAVHREAFYHNISEKATTGFVPLQIVTGQEVTGEGPSKNVDKRSRTATSCE